MKKNERYPAYFRKEKQFVAITGPTTCYVLRPVGSNKNHGVCLDHYITRKQVLSYYGDGKEITAEEFKEMYNKLHAAYLNKILA